MLNRTEISTWLCMWVMCNKPVDIGTLYHAKGSKIVAIEILALISHYHILLENTLQRGFILTSGHHQG